MIELSDGRGELWQWDTGRRVSVDAPCTEVHFAVNVYGHSFDVPVNEGVADIPDVLLQTDGNLNVWGFVGTAGEGYTRISKVFRVNRRNKPAGYTYTPTAQISLETIRKEIEETKRKLGEKIGAEELGKAVADALRQAKDSGEFDGEPGVSPHIGANGNWFVGTVDTGVQAQGEDYVLTEYDKIQIAGIVLGELPKYNGEVEDV